MWQVLGINPTADKKAIKRAYAKKLKLTRPDEQPEEFQALHQAYKAALAEATRIKAESEHDTELVYGGDQAASHTEAVSADGFLAEEMCESNAEPLTRSKHDLAETSADILMSENPLHSYVASAQPPLDAASDQASTHFHAHPLPELTQVEYDMSTAEDSAVNTSIVGVDDGDLSGLSAEQQAFQHLLERVEALLDPMQDYQSAENWRFLTQTPLILEPDFNWAVGCETLKLIDAHNNSVNELGCSKQVLCQSVTQYLDGIFAWSDNKAYLRDELESDVYLALVEPLLEREQGVDTDNSAIRGLRGGAQVRRLYKDEGNSDHYRIGGDFRRAMAFIIDIVILSFIAAVASELIFSMASAVVITTIKSNDIWLLLSLYFSYFWLMDGPYWQGSIGKKFLCLKVMDSDYEPVSWLRSFARTFIFFFSNIAFRIVLLINVFLKGRYVHDRVTSTLVIDMRRIKRSH